MIIETLDEIIEEIADKIGIYGICDENTDECGHCRCCFVSDLKDRIELAIENENKLKSVNL